MKKLDRKAIKFRKDDAVKLLQDFFLRAIEEHKIGTMLQIFPHFNKMIMVRHRLLALERQQRRVQ